MIAAEIKTKTTEIHAVQQHKVALEAQLLTLQALLEEQDAADSPHDLRTQALLKRDKKK